MRLSIPGSLLLGMIVLTAAATPPAGAAESASDAQTLKLREKIISGYTSYFFKIPQKEINKQLLDPMAEAGFNAVSFKISNRFDADNPEQVRKLTRLIRACEQRGLTFMVYDWTTSKGRVPAGHEDIPPFVAYDGRTFENRYSIIHWAMWKEEFSEALDLARLSNRLPIKAVKLDLERFEQINHPATASYDDATWARYASDHPDAPSDLAADERGPWLDAHGRLDAYKQWWRDQVVQVAKRFEREMHKINPDLWLGMMPGQKAVPPGTDLIFKAVAPHLATERAPAIMDCWQYGLGYGKRVRAEVRKLKALNPDNLVVQWVTPRGNYPSDLYNRTYHLAMASDGYSIWQMKMLWPGRANRYDLAPGHKEGEYWKAFRLVNRLVRRDLARGIDQPESLELKPLKRKRIASKSGGRGGVSLNLNQSVPALAPAGQKDRPRSGGESADEAEQTPWIVLREQARLYLYADQGETIRIDLRHMKNGSISYALINDAHKVLAKGVINNSQDKPRTIKEEDVAGGGYVLLLKSATNPWFGVRVHDVPAAVSMKPEAYLFRPQRHKSVFWVTRSDLEGTAKVKVGVDRGQMIEVTLNDGEPVTGTHPEPVMLDLPEGKRAHKITLEAPANLKRYGMHLEEVHIKGQGAVEPYLSLGKSRRLRTAEQ